MYKSLLLPEPALAEQLFQAIKLLDNVSSIDFYLLINLSGKERFVLRPPDSNSEGCSGVFYGQNELPATKYNKFFMVRVKYKYSLRAGRSLNMRNPVT